MTINSGHFNSVILVKRRRRDDTDARLTVNECDMRYHEYTSPRLLKPLEDLLGQMPAVEYPRHHTGAKYHLCGTILVIHCNRRPLYLV